MLAEVRESSNGELEIEKHLDNVLRPDDMESLSEDGKRMATVRRELRSGKEADSQEEVKCSGEFYPVDWKRRRQVDNQRDGEREVEEVNETEITIREVELAQEEELQQATEDETKSDEEESEEMTRSEDSISGEGDVEEGECNWDGTMAEPKAVKNEGTMETETINDMRKVEKSPSWTNAEKNGPKSELEEASRMGELGQELKKESDLTDASTGDARESENEDNESIMKQASTMSGVEYADNQEVPLEGKSINTKEEQCDKVKEMSKYIVDLLQDTESKWECSETYEVESEEQEASLSLSEEDQSVDEDEVSSMKDKAGDVEMDGNKGEESLMSTDEVKANTAGSAEVVPQVEDEESNFKNEESEIVITHAYEVVQIRKELAGNKEATQTNVVEEDGGVEGKAEWDQMEGTSEVTCEEQESERDDGYHAVEPATEMKEGGENQDVIPQHEPMNSKEVVDGDGREDIDLAMKRMMSSASLVNAQMEKSYGDYGTAV